jgi:hypothetical protein
MPRRRPRLRFHLETLLVAVVVAGLGSRVITYLLRWYSSDREANSTLRGVALGLITAALSLGAIVFITRDKSDTPRQRID